MIYKQMILFLLLLIHIVYGNSGGYSKYNSYNSYSNYGTTSCQLFEDKVYQLTVQFPGNRPFNAGLRLFPDGRFDEIFSVANGNNLDQVGADMALSSRFGYYKCLPYNKMMLTGFGYLYRTNKVPFLVDNFAVVMHDYHFRFSSDGRTCTGLVKFAVLPPGTNPFTTTTTLFEGPTGKVTCELLNFRTRYILSPV